MAPEAKKQQKIYQFIDSEAAPKIPACKTSINILIPDSDSHENTEGYLRRHISTCISV